MYKNCLRCEKRKVISRFRSPEDKLCDQCLSIGEKRAETLRKRQGVCVTCGKTFEGSCEGQRWCSKKCTPKSPSYTPIPVQDVEAICENCGDVFIKKVPKQRFCSHECRDTRKARGRFLILERDRFRCFYCGVSSVEDGAKLHVDHVLPVSLGGGDTAGNLVTACELCNLEKLSSEFKPQTLEHIKAALSKRNLIFGLAPNQVIDLPDTAEYRRAFSDQRPMKRRKQKWNKDQIKLF